MVGQNDHDEDNVVSPEAALDVLLDAVASVPFKMAVFDKNDRVVACSEKFRASFTDALSVLPDNLLASSITFQEMIEAKVASRHSAKVVPEKLKLELARHRVPGGWQRDMRIAGSWQRRIKGETPKGNVVSVEISIDELMQKSSALAKAKQQLEYQAFHDPLTDLPNRRALAAHLDQILNDATDTGAQTALLHVDLDKFKAVNDTMGHDAGDQVLRKAADVLRRSVRSVDFVARVGGDEFVVVQQNAASNLEAAAVAQRIVNTMKEPIEYGDEFCQIGASIGISMAGPGDDLDRLLTEADHALYEAKRKGRGCFDFFEPVFRDRHMAQLKNINAAREAMLLRAFEPYFQAQICTKTNRLIGVEALARWIDQEKGLRHPEEFFPYLKEANLMGELDAMMIEKSLIAIGQWREEGVEVPRVSINVSAQWLSREDIVEHAKWIVDDAGLTPEHIGFEVLEDAVNDVMISEAQDNFARLKEAGFHIALDHFGTGDASISGLRRVAFDRVKIDESFVVGIDHDPEVRTICSALIHLLHDLNLEPMCAGVETTEQLDAVAKLGCNLFQGFAVCRPMSAAHFAVWAADYAENLPPALSA